MSIFIGLPLTDGGLTGFVAGRKSYNARLAARFRCRAVLSARIHSICDTGDATLSAVGID
jgi:hypothetical protein